MNNDNCHLIIFAEDTAPVIGGFELEGVIRKVIFKILMVILVFLFLQINSQLPFTACLRLQI